LGDNPTTLEAEYANGFLAKIAGPVRQGPGCSGGDISFQGVWDE
jgi:hypothetical protein